MLEQDQSEDELLVLPLRQNSSFEQPNEVKRSSAYEIPDQGRDSPRSSVRRRRWGGASLFGNKEFQMSAATRLASTDRKRNADPLESGRCKSCWGAECLSCNLRGARSTPPSPSYSARTHSARDHSWDRSIKSCASSSPRSSFSDSEPSRSGRKQRRSTSTLTAFDAQFDRYLLIVSVFAFVMTSVGILLKGY